jgi:hypothetical protein
MNWHPQFRRALTLAAALALAGCAGPPTFRGLLKERYPGYDQILPAATALPNEPGFDYLPGNVLALTLEKRSTWRQSALWNNIGIFCPTNVPLSALKPEPRRSVKVVYDVDRSLRKALGLSKLKTSLQLEPNEIEVLRRVSISIESPTIYALRAGGPRPRYVQACIDALAARSDLHKINSVLVGTVRMDFVFKENVSLLVRLNLLNKINGSAGFGAVRGESYSIVSENVVFGTRLRPVRLKRPSAKPLLVSMIRVN